MGNNYNGKSSNKSWQTNRSFNNNRNQNSSNNDIRNSINYSYAPYNFIPLSNRVIERYKSISELPRHDEFISGTLSGEITYTIENVTDLIISDGSGNSKKRIPNKFFKDVNGNYAIPGSTIRGKLRSNINILGLSTVSEEIEDERFLYRRVAGSTKSLKKEYDDRLGIKRQGGFSVPTKVKAGYILKKDEEEYVLLKFNNKNEPTYYRIKEEELENKARNVKGINYMHNERLTSKYKPYRNNISFDLDNKNNRVKSIGKRDEYKYNGILFNSGKYGVKKPGGVYKKAHYVIREIGDSYEEIKLSVDDIRIYNKYYIKDKKDNLIEDKEEYNYYALPNKKGDKRPCFYTEYNGRIYFGFTPYLRLFYDKSIHEGIHINHKKNIIDYKKAIFGFTNGDEGYKSRISVEDAIAVGNIKTKEHVMVLGEPKATCVNLYLNNGGDKDSLQSYNGEFEIRGIKYYWLKEFVAPEKDKDNVNTIEEAIEKGARFKGKIKFNNLNEDELGLLVWALYIHKDANQNIGKGKPYGFGNIKIKDISIKVQDTNKKYNNIFEEDTQNLEVLQCIEKYKDYVKRYFSDLDNIEDDLSIKTFIEVHKNTNRVEPVNYMSLKKENGNHKTYNEFSLYNPLSEPFKVLGIKSRKPITNTKNIKNNYKTNYTKQNSNTRNYNSKVHNKNKNTSV